MRRRFKSSILVFLFAFVFMVKVGVQAEPQLEKGVINMGSSNASYKNEETNLQDKPGLGDYWGGIFYIPYYFPLKQGAEWKYKVTEESKDNTKKSNEVIKIDGTEIVDGVETKRRYEVEYNLDGSRGEEMYKCIATNQEGVMVYKEYELNLDSSIKEYNFENPPRIYFPAKMRIGQEFTTHCLDTNYDYLDIFEELAIEGRTVELEELENVKVPAGKFRRCLKIRFSEVSDESADIEHYEDYVNHEAIKGWIWLARGVGIVKSVTIEAEFNSKTKLTETKTKIIELISYKINNGIK